MQKYLHRIAEIGHALGLSHPGLPPDIETRVGMGFVGIKDIPKWDLHDKGGNYELQS